MRQALLVVGIVLVVAGCGGGSKSSQATTVVSTTVVTTTTSTTTSSGGDFHVVTHGRYHYPQILVTNYMRSCIANGGAKKRAYCACTLDKLSNDVSIRDFTEIGLSKTIPKRIRTLMTNAVAACANKLS